MRYRVALAVMAALTASISAPARAQDAVEGEKVFKRQCFVCHTATAEGANKQGPKLFGIIGRKSGSVDGFRYTDANKNANIVWTAETLDPYLLDPRKVVPGTTMAFAGLRKEEDRKNLIAYLLTLK